MKTNPWFTQAMGCALRNFDKKEFYKWGYMSNSRCVKDFFSAYCAGGEL